MPKQLFFKLLLGFWLICVLIAGAVIALPVIIDQKVDFKKQLIRTHQQFAQRLSNSTDLARQLRRLTRTKQISMPNPRQHDKRQHRALFITSESGAALGFTPLPPDINKAIKRLKHKNRPRRYHFKQSIVFGPYPFIHQGNSYQLYVREHRPEIYRHYLSSLSENRWLLLFVMALVSGLCCAFFAWHITRPIKSLERTAKQLALGQLSARAQPLTLRRRDEIGQLAHSFNEMAESVEQMMLNQQRLLSDISHELRTPLTRLQLALAIGRRQQDGQLAQASRIEQEANLIDKMLQQLLVLSRLRINNSLPFTKVAIAELLDDIIDNAIFEARQYDKTVTSQPSPDITIDALEEPLASAIENVIRNAISYAKTNVTLSTSLSKTHLTIAIEDNGSGVPSEHLDKLFEPFYRVSDARERRSGGTGLGLAIASEAIARHRGSINAYNTAHGGLNVVINIPRHQ
ncbi:MAG: HAMP domain-containing protein [Gammaproteobacteria bacterium]|nr:HAMP domain-containing protein [Gammaproteobacteria bacterium]